MTRPLSKAQLDRLKSQLQERNTVLREEIRAGLDDAGEARLAREVGDLQDQAVASLLDDVRIADIERDVAELRDVEAALDRLERAEYGMCEDCGERVPYKRLLAFPTARRCLECQERHERSAGAGRVATL